MQEKKKLAVSKVETTKTRAREIFSQMAPFTVNAELEDEDGTGQTPQSCIPPQPPSDREA